MFARVSTYELEQGRASEAMAAFEPAIEGIRQLDGFVDGFFLVERDGLTAMTVTLWESLDTMERSRIAATPRAERRCARGRRHRDELVRVRGGAPHGRRRARAKRLGRVDRGSPLRAGAGSGIGWSP